MTGKIHTLPQIKEITGESGCVDRLNIKSFYIELESYVQIDFIPTIELEAKYKRIKYKIKKYFSNQTIPNLHRDIIIDMVERNSARHLSIENINIFFKIEITCFYKEIPTEFKTPENLAMIDEIYQDIVDIIYQEDLVLKRDCGVRK